MKNPARNDVHPLLNTDASDLSERLVVGGHWAMGKEGGGVVLRQTWQVGPSAELLALSGEDGSCRTSYPAWIGLCHLLCLVVNCPGFQASNACQVLRILQFADSVRSHQPNRAVGFCRCFGPHALW